MSTAGRPGPPPWLDPLRSAAATVTPDQLSRFLPPAEGGRAAAVLLLFGVGQEGPDILLLQRADALRAHAGQPAFPGGATDPEDRGPAHTALRESAEEVGVDPAGVQVLAELPALFLPVSGFVVTPVLGWWHTPTPVAAVDPVETASVARVPIARLTDPASRFRVRHPSGYIGPAFAAGGMLVWGFTAGLLDRVLALGGWARPWDAADVRDLPADIVALSTGDRAPRPGDVPVDVPGDEPVDAAGADPGSRGAGPAAAPR